MQYQVRRPFRWREKNLQREDTLIPKGNEEAFRANQLAISGFLVPVLESEFVDSLQAAGVKVGRVVKAEGKKATDNGDKEGSNVETNKRNTKR